MRALKIEGYFYLRRESLKVAGLPTLLIVTPVTYLLIAAMPASVNTLYPPRTFKGSLLVMRASKSGEGGRSQWSP
jgi:hypothetical protein